MPDHYVFRMLFSKGIPLENLRVARVEGGPTERDGRKIWRVLAENYHLFRATPSKMWIDHSFEYVFGLVPAFSAANAESFMTILPTVLRRMTSDPGNCSTAFGSRP